MTPHRYTIQGYYLHNGAKSRFVPHVQGVDNIEHFRKEIMQQNAGKDVYLEYRTNKK